MKLSRLYKGLLWVVLGLTMSAAALASGGIDQFCVYNNGRIVFRINADSIAFVNAGRKEEQSANPKQASKKGAKAKNTPEPPKDAPEAKADDLPF